MAKIVPGCLDHAMATFNQMLSEGIEPDTTTRNTLIDCHCKAGWHDRAEQLFEEMKEKGVFTAFENTLRVIGGDGLKPNLLALNSLINAFRDDRRDAEAFTVLQYLKANCVKPDVVTYTMLMKALIRVDKFHKVPSVFEEMILSGCTPDRKARAMLLSALRYMKQAVKS
ncbi:pentatricopeptide repeat-containing protein At5g42310, chloroplastic-like [Hibiscus syriacus]|uniref:pentatricopeptide repeat-containing protein At5g42310, chloroplastic-like n=1 Tax=Hibiscus syriacus TaxID=106335 RepID=UPI001922E247|nr:pentatricopeptide repeat-containing protein At5g42310, chloroplastic-like [Hibiscus syriacus]